MQIRRAFSRNEWCKPQLYSLAKRYRNDSLRTTEALPM